MLYLNKGVREEQRARRSLLERNSDYREQLLI
jgi:hypothetical protein